LETGLRSSKWQAGPHGAEDPNGLINILSGYEILLISGFDLVLSELAPGLFGQDRLKFVRIGVQGFTCIDRGPFGGQMKKDSILA